ncbi:hypothetical protein MLD38_019317 [Melastoma candidum]|uniref:Uncharacterized protein n=1 Tax=Melastoma candidum TaxID=119954 RepID=A0ACB9QVS9_9MYRT|nr:hypothetical protein MLD38_019317 [Melastoma candidum]
MTSDEEEVTYYVVMSLSALTLISLCVSLAILCKKMPVESGESLPTKRLARSYGLSEIDDATDGFNPARVVGRGGFGIVYAAVLETGQLAAVKRIYPGLVLINDVGFGFAAVIRSISSALHPNIVPVIGFSQAPGERIIVNEFVGLGSLEFYLHHEGDENVSLLDWSRRIRIAAGAARGLEYLHSQNIRHGLVKASNVLIDINFTARVSDYGLSFLAPLKEDDRSTEADVYRFGVLLLEILSGRRSEECGGPALAKWAVPLIKGSEFGELLDRRLSIPKDTVILQRLARVALACVGNSRRNRPSMVEVAAILGNLESQV